MLRNRPRPPPRVRQMRLCVSAVRGIAMRTNSTKAVFVLIFSSREIIDSMEIGDGHAAVGRKSKQKRNNSETPNGSVPENCCYCRSAVKSDRFYCEPAAWAVSWRGLAGDAATSSSGRKFIRRKKTPRATDSGCDPPKG